MNRNAIATITRQGKTIMRTTGVDTVGPERIFGVRRVLPVVRRRCLEALVERLRPGEPGTWPDPFVSDGSMCQ